MMNSFNSNRFWMALKSHLQDSRKALLSNFLIMTCYLLALQLFFIFYFASHNQYDYLLEVTVTYSAATFIFVIVYGASYIMGPRKPERRAAFLGLQATALEKYIIRYVYVTVILALGFMLAFAFADLLRMLFIGIIDGDFTCGLPVLIKELVSPNEQSFDIMLLIFELGAFFFGHSIFVLGGTLFPRYQFLLTSLCFCAFIALLTVLPINSFIDQVDKSGTVTGYVALVIFYLLAAFNYWYAYIRFRNQSHTL
ncbi:MAG: hypothetical protein IJQ60_03375 [Prevotella sp.]|nr:hypothetical protein [Prevotella sp.]MBR0262906.1 hypothetical protein [Prevotella sp.]